VLFPMIEAALSTNELVELAFALDHPPDGRS
jgi:hypothetical protein